MEAHMPAGALKSPMHALDSVVSSLEAEDTSPRISRLLRALTTPQATVGNHSQVHHGQKAYLNGESGGRYTEKTTDRHGVVAGAPVLVFYAGSIVVGFSRQNNAPRTSRQNDGQI